MSGKEENLTEFSWFWEMHTPTADRQSRLKMIHIRGELRSWVDLTVTVQQSPRRYENKFVVSTELVLPCPNGFYLERIEDIFHWIFWWKMFPHSDAPSNVTAMLHFSIENNLFDFSHLRAENSTGWNTFHSKSLEFITHTGRHSELLALFQGILGMVKIQLCYEIQNVSCVFHKEGEKTQKNASLFSKVLWLEGLIENHAHETIPQQCNFPLTCWNYSVPTSMDYNIVSLIYFERELLPIVGTLQPVELKSWYRAKQMCDSANSALPSFGSRTDVENFVTQLKNSYLLPTLSSVFIGLKSMHQQPNALTVEQPVKWMSGDPLSFQQWKNYNYNEITTQYLKATHISNVSAYECLGCAANMTACNIPAEVLSQSILSPDITSNEVCTAVPAWNLVRFEWVSADCIKPLVDHVICTVGIMLNPNISLEVPALVCPLSAVKLDTTCFTFSWLEMQSHCKKQLHSEGITSPFRADTKKMINIVVNATNVVIAPIIFPKANRTISFQQMFNKYNFVQETTRCNTTEGFYLRSTSVHSAFVPQNLFCCSSMAYISKFYLCDGHHDCHDGSDEKTCQCLVSVFSCQISEPIPCESRLNKCLLVLLMKNMELCTALHSKNYFHLSANQKHFHCTGGHEQDIPNIMVNDLVADCGPQANDETHLVSLLKFGRKHRCKNKEQIPCRKGHTKCFFVYEICSYTLDIAGNLHPCRTGEHLEKCNKFECNMMFKCPSSYCIPWDYICDGKWDCAQGKDEPSYECEMQHCQNQMKCRTSSVCIHLSQVCDDKINCPLKDDEILCDLENIFCPLGCHCTLHLINCTKNTIKNNMFTQPLPFSVIVFNNMCNVGELMLGVVFSRATFVSFKFSGIQFPCLFGSFERIVFIDMSSNEIQLVDSLCFSTKEFLQKILIRRNEISGILPKAFHNLPNLRVLDVSCNALETVSPIIIQNTPKLEVLLLVGNSLQEISYKIILSLQVFGIKTDDNRICCSLLLVSCITTQECYSLLESDSMNYILILMISLIFLLNILCLTQHVKIQFDRFDGYKCIIRTANMCNFIHGIYLCSLFTAQGYYDESFMLEYIRWKQCAPCYILFTVSLWHTLYSPSISCLLALARFMVVLHPLKTKWKRAQFVGRILLQSMLLSVTSSVVSSIIQWQLHHIIPFEFCTPQVDFSKSFTFVKLGALTIACVQFGGGIFLLVAHTLLLVNIKKSQEIANELTGRHNTHLRKISGHTIALTASDVISWIPSNIIILLGIFNESFDPSVLKWCLIVLCSSSSVCNPLIFSYPLLRTKYVAMCSKQQSDPNQPK